jgi:hypothetical protein
MGTIVRISKHITPQDARKALDKLSKKSSKIKTKTLADFYGKMPNIYEDGLAYQKKLRDEWR